MTWDAPPVKIATRTELEQRLRREHPLRYLQWKILCWWRGI